MNRIMKRTLAVGLVLASLGGTGAFAWEWWQNGRFTAATDNAYVRGDITAVGPKVPGYVAGVLVDDNRMVQAGDILLRIDDADFRAQVDRAEAAIAQTGAATENLERRKEMQLAVINQADAAVDAAKADLHLARRNFDRSSQLVGLGWTTRRDHDVTIAGAGRATAGLVHARAAAVAAREQLAVTESEASQITARRQEAEAAMRLAQIALTDTIIRAPVAGVVGNKHVQPGEYIRPGSMLLSIVPLEGVWVVANFKETQVHRMQVGQRAHITVDGYPDAALNGTIDSLAPASGAAFSLLPPDNATGNFTKVVQRVPVKIRLVPGHPLVGRLVPGLSVKASVDLRTSPVALKPLDGDHPVAPMASIYGERRMP